ncbi:MAG TPA: ABC transporter ATP-binding protein [Anaerolineae bacterium]|nr:ABC transporter ATP-binding protein [Anaerolineae bacterium]
MPSFAIETTNLTRRFADKIAVNALNLQVPEGAFFGFLGPNGAGKSTTIKMLVGLLRPTSGRATIGGIDVWADPLAAKQQVGVLPEGMNLYERLTGREMIEFAGAMYGVEEAVVKSRTEELLVLMDLIDSAEKMIVDYSAGMKKKTGLAAALIHAPKVLFLDEPFEGVDAISGRAIRDILQQLRSSGTTIFFSSHIMEVVERLCTQVAVINHGELVAQGTMQELRQRAAAGDEATLEELFLRVVGADETHEGSLSWLR